MYSGEDIKQAIANGKLAIDPYFEKNIRPAGLVLHLGAHLLRPLPGKVVDVKQNVIPDYEEITVTTDKPYELEPGGFVLGHTLEIVSVSSKIGFFIEGRSTLARVGLTVVQTAMLVYPGHNERAVTLEIANNGVNPVLLYHTMKIARAAVFELRTESKIEYDDTGKYRTQKEVGKPIFKDELM